MFPSRESATSRRTGRRSPRSRSAATIVEFLVVFPLIVIFLVAVIEVGLIMGGLKQVALASRVGARAAARLPRGVVLGATDLPNDVRTAVNQQLQSVNIGSACRITMQHSVDGGAGGAGGGPGPHIVLNDPLATCVCPAPATNLPAGQEYVRVTVCVELSQVVPNLLGGMGFSTSGKIVSYTTTNRFEN